MDRIRRDIDGNSYIEAFPTISANIVIFLHGIFGSHKETWAETPSQIMTSRVFASFDYGSFGYTSPTVDFRDPEIIVDKLVLMFRAYLRAYRNIFFVAHSMGGLLVRHAIIRMLKDPKDRAIAANVRLCVMVASPITGSPVARKLAKFLKLYKLNKRVTYLADPTVEGVNMSDAYMQAVVQYKKNGGPDETVPRFYYFVGIQDPLVFKPENEFATPYDKYEGAVEGGHNTIKVGLDINSVLIQRTIQLVQEALAVSTAEQSNAIAIVKEANRKREDASREHPGLAHAPAVHGALTVTVILISCSANKSDADEVEHPRNGGLLDLLADNRLAAIVLERRSRIRTLVQAGKINGVEFQQGNRAAMPANRRLAFGPDFGGVIDERRYLPAYRRYVGRCYRASQEEWERFFREHRDTEILIMSGLYGLISATDYIQNYDVHLTDVDLSSTINVQGYWKNQDLMTQILRSHLEWLDLQGRPVGLVIDALSELSYQETINWNMIEPRWRVLHRVFEAAAGRYALENLGVWIQDVIRNSGICKTLVPDRLYDNTRFIEEDRIGFETSINSSPLPVAREPRG